MQPHRLFSFLFLLAFTTLNSYAQTQITIHTQNTSKEYNQTLKNLLTEAASGKQMVVFENDAKDSSPEVIKSYLAMRFSDNLDVIRPLKDSKAPLIFGLSDPYILGMFHNISRARVQVFKSLDNTRANKGVIADIDGLKAAVSFYSVIQSPQGRKIWKELIEDKDAFTSGALKKWTETYFKKAAFEDVQDVFRKETKKLDFYLKKEYFSKYLVENSKARIDGKDEDKDNASKILGGFYGVIDEVDLVAMLAVLHELQIRWANEITRVYGKDKGFPTVQLTLSCTEDFFNAKFPENDKKVMDAVYGDLRLNTILRNARGYIQEAKDKKVNISFIVSEVFAGHLEKYLSEEYKGPDFKVTKR